MASSSLNKAELISLVRRIVDADGSEGELDRLMDIPCTSVPHPEVLDLIFYPEIDRTPEEIVDEALNHRPIEL